MSDAGDGDGVTTGDGDGVTTAGGALASGPLGLGDARLGARQADIATARQATAAAARSGRVVI